MKIPRFLGVWYQWDVSAGSLMKFDYGEESEELFGQLCQNL